MSLSFPRTRARRHTETRVPGAVATKTLYLAKRASTMSAVSALRARACASRDLSPAPPRGSPSGRCFGFGSLGTGQAPQTRPPAFRATATLTRRAFRVGARARRAASHVRRRRPARTARLRRGRPREPRTNRRPRKCPCLSPWTKKTKTKPPPARGVPATTSCATRGRTRRYGSVENRRTACHRVGHQAHVYHAERVLPRRGRHAASSTSRRATTSTRAS